MKATHLPKSNTIITENEQGLHIIIPKPREWGRATVASIGILMCGLTTLMLLVSVPEVWDDPSKPFWLFVLILMIFIAGDILLAQALLWDLTGKIVIYINSDRLNLQHEMLFFKHEQKFELTKVKDFQVNRIEELILRDISNQVIHPEDLFTRLLNFDIRNLHKLQMNKLKNPTHQFALFEFSDGLCNGISFKYGSENYKFGQGLIRGSEAEHLVKLIIERYRILSSQ